MKTKKRTEREQEWDKKRAALRSEARRNQRAFDRLCDEADKKHRAKTKTFVFRWNAYGTLVLRAKNEDRACELFDALGWDELWNRSQDPKDLDSGLESSK